MFLRFVILCGLCGVWFLPLPSLAAPAWTYDDDYTGQEDWGALPGYGLCRSGLRQSPVVISYTKEKTDKKPLKFTYRPSQGLPTRTTKSFTVDTRKSGFVRADNTIYWLKTIELHSPSEHMVRETYYPLEIQLVHESSNGKKLIVAIFANIGKANTAIENIVGAKTVFPLDVNNLLPKTLTYYGYAGSFTHPPCTEEVEWRILKTPIELSKAQLSAITKVVGRNARLPQPLYMREISETSK